MAPTTTVKLTVDFRVFAESIIEAAERLSPGAAEAYVAKRAMQNEQRDLMDVRSYYNLTDEAARAALQRDDIQADRPQWTGDFDRSLARG